MSTKTAPTPDLETSARIVERWPGLSDDARQDLVAKAEPFAGGDKAGDFPLTAEVMARDEQSKRGFVDGGTMSLEEMQALVGAFHAFTALSTPARTSLASI